MTRKDGVTRAVRRACATGRAAISSGWSADDQTAEATNVTAGQAFDGRVLIERGLAPGDQVVTDGHFRLENGTAIEIIKTEPRRDRREAAPAPS